MVLSNVISYGGSHLVSRTTDIYELTLFNESVKKNLFVNYWFGSVNHLEPLLTPFNLISWENTTILSLAEFVENFEWMSKKYIIFRRKNKHEGPP